MDPLASDRKEQGNRHYRQRQYREAFACYVEAVRIDPNYADAWHNLGMTCRALGYDEEAGVCFEKEKHCQVHETRGNDHPGSPRRPDFFSRPSRQEPGLSPQKMPGMRNRYSKRNISIFLAIAVLAILAVVAISPPGPGHGTGPDVSGISDTVGVVPVTSTIIPLAQVTKNQVVTAPATARIPPDNQVPVKYQSLKTGGVSRTFPYVLRGQEDSITLTLYKGVYDSVRKEDPYCYVGTSDRYQKFIELPAQDPYFDEIVDRIRSKTKNPDDQARIAVSLVQKIPYDENMARSGSLEIRYPYATLWDDKGVCCEKSVLLALILKKLGFGVAIFEFPEEQHTAVGISVPGRYTYKDTGYSFIETTTPSIISDGNGDYPEFGKIRSTPEVLPVSPGKSFDSVSEEWEDAAEWDRLDAMGPVLDKYDYHSWQTLCTKYGIVPGG
ncbi:MAG TPA: tetratricopeptide repeat protein [Methanoregulaceae archaeon]|nr:tetratricopeptide repeat protein [Methanoregulaceae archaeon]